MGVIRVVRVAGVASVQDLGRPGLRHRGIPPGGALVPEDLASANARCGNPPDAAGIEWIGRLVLDDGVERTFDAGPRVATLAVPGGVASAPVHGGRGASWAAGIGRPLAAGDVLPTGGAGEPVVAVPGASGPVAVIPGPDAVPGAVEALLAGPWRVLPASDRVGTRLAGAGMPPVRTGRSTPMHRGAIQLLPDGTLAVLGPDHPITGGYPVIAVVIPGHVGRVGALLPGSAVRYELFRSLRST